MPRTENAKTAASIRCDFLVVAWCSVSLIATFGLCVLIGLKAVGIATVLVSVAAWKINWSKRPPSPTFWRYCWFALLLFDLGLAVYENMRL
ncbi:hypothetical protein AWB64_00539 [Caballeronia sordidicola]|uniref:Uncharacterized protein n=1 Tax=Caballeronia sordidicola TaxID=196367 RepID=A0A158EYS9_CABSO|nr:hypothetical protein AWB64_00539 [Caballeronia sordidicola]